MALAAAERAQADEEHENGSGPLSPTSSVGSPALAPKFDGAHLNAGHAGAVVPFKRGAQRKELEELQARLDTSEATHGVERRSSRTRGQPLRRSSRTPALQQRLPRTLLTHMRTSPTHMRPWEAERARFEQQETRRAQLVDDMEDERLRWEQEREDLVARAKDQIAAAADGLRELVQRFDVPLFSRESGMGVFVDALSRHLEKQTQGAQESENLLVEEVEKRAALSRELERAKEGIQALRTRSPPVSPRSFIRRCPGGARNVQTIASQRRAAVPGRCTPRNRGPRPSLSRRTPRASWRSCSPSGRRSRLQKRALHGSAAPRGLSAQAAGGRRPACTRVHQAAPALT